MRTPPFAAAQDPAWTYTAQTLVPTSAAPVHRSGFRLAPMLRVAASIVPGSRSAGASHRTSVTVLAGGAIYGQRGAVEVTLPLGFEANCAPEDFRARPSLPYTARLAAGRERLSHERVSSRAFLVNAKTTCSK